MRYQDAVTIDGGESINNVLSELRISQIPLTSAGVAISLAAIAKAGGSGNFDGTIEISLFIGGRQVIERAVLGLLDNANVNDAPALPDDLLVSGEPGLPGELIQLSLRSTGADTLDGGQLLYAIDVSEV